MSEQDVAPEAEAKEDAVVESEATENTEGQEQDQPAEDEAKPEGEDKPEDEEVSKSKARRERRKAEMARLKQEAREADEKSQKLQARLDRIEQAAQSQQPPKEGDFEDYNEYLMALAAHRSVAALDERDKREITEETEAQKKQSEALRKQAEAELAESWQEQVLEAKERYADFDQVALDPRVPVTDDMVNLIASSDNGADIAYFLGSNRQEAARISQMEPLEQARALGAIEARLSMPKPKTQTEAPDPITPIKPKSSGGLKDPSKMSMEEYMAARKAGKLK